MAARVIEAARVLALATVVTVVMAAPVLRAPSERVFGMDIAGRHHDPFTVMQQFAHPPGAGIYSQPVTDVPGGLAARAFSPVAAYNWIVLLSFPLSAVAAYLLGRHLALSHVAALVAAMAFAFSPFHLAQAAYHPHVAQTQWIPLYLLALWRCLDDASPAAVALLAAATAAVTLSNFYGGLIAAVITPVAVGAYWIATRGREAGHLRRLAITVGALILIGAAGVAYASYTAGPIVANRAAFAFPRADLVRYSAKWWSYLVPPVEHPLLGASARGFWTAAGVREGLLEQQVSLGWGIVGLAVIAVFAWSIERRLVGSPAEARAAQQHEGRRVPLLAVVAIAALLCSLSPERTIGGFTLVGPAAVLHDLLPMFRSYARFGVVVQLMAALLAGIGIDYLRRTGARRGRITAIALVLIAAGEYAVSPLTLWRDVLPTRAHRWVTRQPGPPRALDCAPLTQESASVQWLSGDRVTLAGGAIEDCTEPDLPVKLAAAGFTHLIVRRGTPESQAFDDHALPEGLRAAARFPDGRVFAVTAAAPAIYTAAMTGFFEREYAGRRSWRWMAAEAEWTIVNTRHDPVVATLAVELTSFHRPRRMEVMLDGRCVLTIVVEPSGRVHHLGPLTIAPGRHALGFHAIETPVPAGDEAGSHDRRRLSVSIGNWSWTAEQKP